MLRTAHALPAGRSPEQRLVSIAIVVGLHIAVIAAIISALTFKVPNYVLPVLHVFVPKIDTTETPRPRVDHVRLITPTGPAIPQPKWTEVTPPPSGPAGGNNPPVPTTPVVIVGAHAIASSHTIPGYPPLDMRLGHVGNVLLRLDIDERGSVTGATVERSSGYETLDKTAVNWVIAHWRYEPATRDGVPIASATRALVTFRLN